MSTAIIPAPSGGGGTTITIDDRLLDTSTNPVQNKVVKAVLDTKGTYSKPEGGIPLTDFSDDVRQVIDQKQEQLISGVNIVTINSRSLVGPGNIDIGGGGTITVDSELNDTSTNPVQNKVVKAAIDGKYTKPPTGIPASHLATNSVTTAKIADGNVTAAKLASDINQTINGKQDKLTSTTKLATINDQDLFYGGSITIGSGGTIIVDDELNDTSTNPVQNKVIKAALDSKGTYSKPSGGIPASDLASGVIPTIDSSLDASSTRAVQNKVVKAALDAKAGTSTATTSSDGLMSSTDKTKLNGIATGAEVNQNAFSNIKVGTTTIAANSKTDTLTLVAGTNVTLTPDATNDKITIAASGGGTITVDDELSDTSTNPVQNKVIKAALDRKGPYYIDFDGSVVECETIQAAIDGCPLHGTVTIPWYGSSYRVSSTIHIWKPITLESNYTGLYPYGTLAYASTNNIGKQPAYSATTTKIPPGDFSSAKDAAHTGYGKPLIYSTAADYGIFVHCSGVTLRNISMHCNGLSDTSVSYGHSACVKFYSNEIYEGAAPVYFMHHTLVENCAFQGPSGHASGYQGDGVRCENFGVARFANVYTFNTKNGFWFDNCDLNEQGVTYRGNCTSVTLESCWAQNFKEIGYYFHDMYYASLISCAADATSTSTFNHGYYFDKSYSVNAVGCGAEKVNRGLTLYNSYQVSFEGCIVLTKDDSAAVQVYEPSTVFLNNLRAVTWLPEGASYTPIMLCPGSSAVLINTNIPKIATHTSGDISLPNGGMFDNVTV